MLPYVTARAEYLDHDAGDPFNDGSRLGSNVGADVKLGIGSNLTLDGTVNPDFGQVEVDPAVVNLSDVETFFEERRPFFIEGGTIFTNFGYGGANDFWGFNWGGVDFLYSRRIGRAPQGSVPDADYSSSPSGANILGAAKLTGKVGSWNLGALNALTSREHARLAAGETRTARRGGAAELVRRVTGAEGVRQRPARARLHRHGHGARLRRPAAPERRQRAAHSRSAWTAGYVDEYIIYPKIFNTIILSSNRRRFLQTTNLSA